ncbi:MAG: lysine exporter LysO family protein, partial [Vulcanisaeta sp.]
IFPITMVIGYYLKAWVKTLGLGHYLQYVVMALVFTMSLWAGGVVSSNYVINIVIYAVIYAVTSIIMSLAVTIPIIKTLKIKNSGNDGVVSNGNKPSVKLPAILLTVLVIGWLFGYFMKPPIPSEYINPAIIIELLILILVIGLDIGSSINKKFIAHGSLGVAIAVSAMLGSAVGGLLLSYVLGLSLPESLGVSMGMGWYSLVGPLLSVKFGPAIGTLAFLANFLREQLTYFVVPFMVMGGFRDVSLVSIGGATSMDDTLPIYRLYIGETGGFTAFVSGFVITMILPILLPYVLML